MPQQNSQLHCIVSGRVQGVCYRISTQEKANSMELKGWVRNLPDGRVEVYAAGDSDQLYIFKQWLYQGPAMARVDNIEVLEDTEPQKLDARFTIR